MFGRKKKGEAYWGRRERCREGMRGQILRLLGRKKGEACWERQENTKEKKGGENGLVELAE